ncbi:MAG: alpha/beta hydrolase [Methanobrevibacter sp.]|nr:alpha/beta hydrolase [Methanobrevibacter sp.]MBQ6628266.1 alpha/beta hydrolase [Methanobrevibacter sp.]
MFGTNMSKKVNRITIWCRNCRGDKIHGTAFVPKKDGKYPLVIYSHGYGYNMSFIDSERLAENGIAVYEFDFCGGSPYSKSDGRSTDMSVLTQAEDLDAVIEKLSEQSFVDNDRIYLSGGSQGGYVSILSGERNKNMIQGMILYCPALVINDFEREYFQYRKIPDKFRFGNMMISRRYVDDAKASDVYMAMERFDNPVLYYHGSNDELVPVRYAYEAEKHFPNINLTILPDAGHMLTFGYEDRLFKEMKDFILKGE